MAKPLVDLPDAEEVVRDVLLAAGHTDVRGEFPSNRLSGTSYVLQVDQEPGDARRYPIVERVPVRVTVHVAPGRRTAAKELASDVLADLYTFAGDADCAGIVPRSGRSAISTDPSTRNVMCWVLVRVDLKASLAS